MAYPIQGLTLLHESNNSHIYYRAYLPGADRADQPGGRLRTDFYSLGVTLTIARPGSAVLRQVRRGGGAARATG